MRVLSRLIAALTIAGLMLPVAVSPLLADIDIDSFRLKPDSGPVGTEVYLDGGGTEDDDDYDDAWAYFQLEEDGDNWVRVLDDDDDWDFEDEEVVEGTWDYDFVTEEFEIPECPGGTHRVAVVSKDFGSTADTDDVEGYLESDDDFEVTPKIEFVSVDGEDCDPDEAEGPAGTEVELKGTGFGEDEEDIVVYFGDDKIEAELLADIEADELGTWTGSFIVPAASAGEHDITAGGDDTDEDDCAAAPFMMTAGISIEPTKGVVGTTLTVSGSGFEASEDDIEILFDGKSIKTAFSADNDGTFEVTVTIPNAAMGTHEIDAEGEDTSKSDIDNVDFEVEPAVLMEPTSGNVGTELSVTGTGLPAGTPVIVAYDGVGKGTGATNTNGTLPAVAFAATHTQSVHTANHPVTVTFGDSTLTLTYAMESTAPAKPIPGSPENATRIGILGKQTPTITWRIVDDPSGVNYALQISATPDFSQVLISKTGLIAQGSAIIVSTTGPEMSYTLTETEALPYGTYHWRVKAIDGALNDSGWSAANNFKAGLLPTWALIVIIVLAAVLIGALVYVLIIRDRVGLYD